MANKKRIAFFAEMLIEDIDGAARTIFQLVNRIPNEDFEFMFFTGTPPKSDFPYPCILVPSVKIPRNADYKLALPWFSKTLKSTLDLFNPDVIHISTPSFLGRYAINYALKNNIPVLTIYHTHFISYIQYYFDFIPFLTKSMKNLAIERNRSFYDKCDLVYIPSNAISEELKSYGLKTEKYKLWRRGMNTNLFSPASMDDQLFKAERDLGKKIILFVSRLVWEKNLKSLIAVYKRSRELEKEYQFVIVGDGVAKDELQVEMPDALFTGTLNHDEVSKYYSSADVFLFTSDTETYGNVVVEAMASGLPCVVADAGGPRDLIDQKINGLKCPPNDADAYIDAIDLILENDSLREKFINNGLSLASHLNWDNLAAEYFNDLRDLAKEKLK